MTTLLHKPYLVKMTRNGRCIKNTPKIWPCSLWMTPLKSLRRPLRNFKKVLSFWKIFTIVKIFIATRRNIYKSENLQKKISKINFCQTCWNVILNKFSEFLMVYTQNESLNFSEFFEISHLPRHVLTWCKIIIWIFWNVFFICIWSHITSIKNHRIT